ncbi:MAG: von Willebrand factor type A domain-containing protein [Rubripirellula sp.]
MNRYHPSIVWIALALCLGCGQAAPDAQRTSDNAIAEPLGAASFAMIESASPDGLPMEIAGDGQGPGEGGEKYDRIVENAFLRVGDHPLSTFSIDVDTASYSKVRQYLINYNQMPRPDAVRIEEMLNYFQYDYTAPTPNDTEPFATHVAVSECPWNMQHRLVRMALKGREMENEARPGSNLVLLIDSSGSMKRANKLPLLKRAMRLLLQQLNQNDRVAIVAYAGSAGLVLDSTPASNPNAIMRGLDKVQAGGSTNGGQGLRLAYQVARDNFIENGTNRVMLCTDGDFNVGMAGTDQLVSFVEQESKSGIDLTVLGFGMGNLNDSMLEQISGSGNGNYAFIDTFNEAKKVLVEQLSGTLVTIAKDVKLQIEFNPSKVAAYRLIGYENRMLESEDFNDDKKDAGEIGAGHSVTALYEIVPVGSATVEELPKTDPLKYQQPAKASLAAESDELLTVKLRYKFPEQDNSQLMEHIVFDTGTSFDETDNEFQFAAAVASFGMLLRDSEHRGDWGYGDVMQTAQASTGTDKHGFREEFVELVSVAQSLARSTPKRP